MTRWIAIACLVALGVSAQAAPPPVRRIQRFQGTARVAGKEVRVAIDTWLVPNAAKIDALELPLRGATVVELRGGSLFTIIDGRRQQRRAGDFWALAATSKMSLETENDSAALQTTVVAD